VVPFVAAADADAAAKPQGRGVEQDGLQGRRTTLVETLSPAELGPLLVESFQDAGRGVEGLRAIGEKVLKSSVNTWDQGFLDKLYGSTNAVRNVPMVVWNGSGYTNPRY
jgi:glutamate decarboxylase